MEEKELALAIAAAALDKQAESLEIIDVGGKVSYAGYLVICSGRNDRHVEALVNNVDATLRKKHKIHPLGVEGKGNNKWILMDYGDVIFHVFEDEQRGFYDLDSLWMDAKRVPVHEK